MSFSDKLNEAMGSLEDWEDEFGSVFDWVDAMADGYKPNARQLELIKEYPSAATDYAMRIGKRWPPGEKAIKTSPFHAYQYAVYVLKRRWSEAEETIRSDPNWWSYYKNKFNLPEDF